MGTPGTFLLDGLLQGGSPGEDELRDWVAEAARSGLNFSLEMEGNRFSLLADNAAYPVSKLRGVALDLAMTQLLESLLALYPAKRATLYSTLRSQEFKPGLEVQSVYLINADGTVKVQSRDVASHAPPPVPASPRERVLQSAIVLISVLLLIVLASQFLDWRHLFHRMREVTQPNQGVELESALLAPYLGVKLIKVRQLDGFVELELSRGAQWDASKPEDLDEPVAAPGAPARSWKDFLAVEAMKRGVVRGVFYDEKGVVIGDVQIGLDALRSAKSFVAEVAIPRSQNALKRVVVRP